MVFQFVDSITFNARERYSSDNAIAIDPTSTFVYVVCEVDNSGYQTRVVKIRLSDFIRVDDITFPVGEDDGVPIIIDSAGNFAYVGTIDQATFTYSTIVKVDLNTFTRVGSVVEESCNSCFDIPQTLNIDCPNNFICTGISYSPTKIKLSDLSVVAQNFGAITGISLAPIQK